MPVEKRNMPPLPRTAGLFQRQIAQGNRQRQHNTSQLFAQYLGR